MRLKQMSRMCVLQISEHMSLTMLIRFCWENTADEKENMDNGDMVSRTEANFIKSVCLENFKLFFLVFSFVF